MTYRPELDDYQPALRYNTAAQSLDYWPKVSGSGNVTVSSASVTLYMPQSDTVIETGSATITTSGGYSSLSYSVNTSDTATWPVDEGYRARWQWTVAGESVVRQRTVLFDVAVEPYEPLASLNDLLEEEVDIGDIIERQALRLSDSRTAEQHASAIVLKAWVDVREWVRSQMREEGKIFARCILDHHSINRVIVAQAMHRIYRLEGGVQDGEADMKAREWGKKAFAMFKSLPPMAYDSGTDGIADSTVRGPMTTTSRRSWS